MSDAIVSEEPLAEHDGVLRAMSQDGNFRVMAARSTDTVQGVIDAQNVTSDLAILLANVVTGAVLVRESMAPDLRLQAILQGSDRKSRIVADSHPDGMTRGLVQLPTGKSTFLMGDSAVLQVQRTLHTGAVHQGVVAVPDNGDVSAAFMAYLQDSEQITTMISVGCHMLDGKVQAAGGYVVQLLPEVERAKLAVMTERLEDFRDILPLLAQGKASPRWLLAETLYGMPYDQVAERPLHCGCNCSAARVTASLASLPRGEVEELVASGEVLDIGCDFCGSNYKIHPEQLRGLLTPN